MAQDNAACNTPLLTVERLKEVLNYDPETGIFTHLGSGRRGRASAGRQAGWLKTDHKKSKKIVRRRISIDGNSYYASNLAWLFMTGEWPLSQIDHKDTNSTNDSWGNLRLATNAQNGWNKSLGPRNTTGFKGVRVEKHKYRADITVNKIKKFLGYFSTPEEAAKAYKSAANDLHGEYARAA